MEIKYATKYVWLKEYNEKELLCHYLKSDQKKIKKILNRIDELRITYVIEDASETFFSWFQTFYENKINEKKNAKICNVLEETMGRPGRSLTYKTLTIYQGKEIVGGCIFSDRGDYFSIAYRAFNYEWHKASQIASPSVFAEYIIDQYSIQSGKKKLVHGQDRHPYGLNSSIGLAVFKLSVGCKPMLPKNYTTASIETTLYTSDVLIFELPKEDQVVKTIHLILKENESNKYAQLLKFTENFDIKIHN